MKPRLRIEELTGMISLPRDKFMTIEIGDKRRTRERAKNRTLRHTDAYCDAKDE